MGAVVKSGIRDNGLLDGLAELGLRDLLHLEQNHGGNLLGSESLLLTKVINLDQRRSVLVDDLERPVLDVL